jgi:hypothetical protein
MGSRLLCAPQKADEIIDRIKNPQDVEDLRKALNLAIENLDLHQNETAEEGLTEELKGHGISLEDLLHKYPALAWREQDPKDPIWHGPGFTLKSGFPGDFKFCSANPKS